MKTVRNLSEMNRFNNIISFRTISTSVPYTKDNISVAIWILTNISTYWYHQNNEKIVHTTALVNYLLKSIPKLHRDHRKTILKYGIEVIRMFGDYKTIAENLNYFVQNVGTYYKYKIDWKSQNTLSIAYKYLDLGITYDFEAGANSDPENNTEDHFYEFKEHKVEESKNK